jgi:hypothetical protein
MALVDGVPNGKEYPMFDIDYSVPLLSMMTFAAAMAYASWQIWDVSDLRSHRGDRD